MKYTNALLTIVFALCSTHALAQDDFLNYLTVGEGISAPSVTTPLLHENTGLAQNPAGMVLSDQMHVQVFGAQQDFESSDEELTRYGAFLHFGNGSVAGSVGASKRDYSLQDDSGTNMHVGLAFTVDAINTSFGINGLLYESRDEDGDLVGSNDVDFGFLYGVDSSFRIGFTAYNVLDDSDSAYDRDDYGIGISYSPSDQTVIVVDGRLLTLRNEDTDTAVTASYITPGVKVALDPFQLSLSYRIFNGDSNDDDLFLYSDDSEVLAGFGVAITADAFLQLQYNRLGDYDLGLTFRF